jgi:hypothetical protein
MSLALLLDFIPFVCGNYTVCPSYIKVFPVLESFDPTVREGHVALNTVGVFVTSVIAL